MHLGGRLVASQSSEQGAAEGLSHRLALGAHLTSVSSSAAPEMLWHHLFCTAYIATVGLVNPRKVFLPANDYFHV